MTIREGDFGPRRVLPIGKSDRGDADMQGWRLPLLIVTCVALGSISTALFLAHSFSVQRADDYAALEVCNEIAPECARVLSGDTPVKTRLAECADTVTDLSQSLQDITRASPSWWCGP